MLRSLNIVLMNQDCIGVNAGQCRDRYDLIWNRIYLKQIITQRWFICTDTTGSRLIASDKKLKNCIVVIAGCSCVGFGQIGPCQGYFLIIGVQNYTYIDNGLISNNIQNKIWNCRALVLGQVKVCPLFYENIPVSNPKSKGTGAHHHPLKTLQKSSHFIHNFLFTFWNLL